MFWTFLIISVVAGWFVSVLITSIAMKRAESKGEDYNAKKPLKIWFFLSLTIFLALNLVDLRLSDDVATVSAPVETKPVVSTATNNYSGTSTSSKKTTTTTTTQNYFRMTQTPDSSCFSEVGYNPATQTLKVCFRTTGYYEYYGFSQSDYDAFISADSLGTYFNQNIKGYYSYSKLDDDYEYRRAEEDALEDLYNDWLKDFGEEIPDDVDPRDYYNDQLIEHYDDEPYEEYW